MTLLKSERNSAPARMKTKKSFFLVVLFFCIHLVFASKHGSEGLHGGVRPLGPGKGVAGNEYLIKTEKGKIYLKRPRSSPGTLVIY